MFWILVILLVALGGAAVAGAAASTRKKQLGGGPTRALPAGPTGDLVERTVRDVRVNDVLTIDAKDFLCEGIIAYDEDGHRWVGARAADGADVRWLVVGIERTGAGATRLLTEDNATQVSGYPPEALVIGEIRYVQDKRGAATCALHGELGALSQLKKGRPDGHVERCRWWLYTAPGDDTMLVEQWGADYRVLRGKKVGEGTVELMPGS
ncbi:MAG TPA: DUF4178 domain-containing protein [Kofleriaceae bacterium]